MKYFDRSNKKQNVDNVVGFLNNYGLDKDFKLNIEVNHATLASHTFDHELQVAANANIATDFSPLRVVLRHQVLAQDDETAPSRRSFSYEREAACAYLQGEPRLTDYA